ncbi:MAG: hypothetical protein GX206_01515 [Clostridiales bacterium]|nr:hypothetical protein [Clostridiales bacterium]
MQKFNNTKIFFLLKGIRRIAAEAKTPNNSREVFVDIPNINSNTISPSLFNILKPSSLILKQFLFTLNQ